MSATGLDVFDKTLQITNTWLAEIMEKLAPDRHIARHAVGAVLRTLRQQRRWNAPHRLRGVRGGPVARGGAETFIDGT